MCTARLDSGILIVMLLIFIPTVIGMIWASHRPKPKVSSDFIVLNLALLDASDEVKVLLSCLSAHTWYSSISAEQPYLLRARPGIIDDFPQLKKLVVPNDSITKH